VTRLSLRARLLLGVLALVLLALGIFGLATVTLLRSYLLDRTDAQLANARVPLVQPREGRAPFEPGALEVGTPPDRTERAGRAFGINSFYFLVLDEQGALVNAVPSGLTTSPDPAPELQDITYADASTTSAPFTVSAQGNSAFHYRVLATPSATTRHVIVMAAPLTSDDATIERLLFVEAAVAALVLATVAFIGWRVVGVGLRPLDDMTDTASAIAAGDLSNRVDLPDDRRDEVGRLGSALNSMLSQIEAAFREKEVSEEHLRQFVADASHELRTPLTSIRGYAELYRRGALETPEAVDDAIGRIEDESARMSVLVDDLLLLARLDQGRSLEQEPVDLSAVATDVFRDFQALDADRPATLAFPDGDVVVLGDAVRLHQILANLLDNVRVHTPVGAAVDVVVRMAGNDAVVEVIDQGPGLEPDVAARVFERSFRGEASPRHHAGSGLGLSIVAAIAEAHGGAASVRSTPGRGTTFVVRLPLAGRPAAGAGPSDLLASPT
jgi:two-component system, OmpR family, sensor kinase